jgi:hypothetical protein
MICPGTRRYVTALRVLLIATALLAAPARAIYSEPAAAAPVGDGDFDQGFAAVKSEDWAVAVAALERAAAKHRDGADVLNARSRTITARWNSTPRISAHTNTSARPTSWPEIWCKPWSTSPFSNGYAARPRTARRTTIWHARLPLTAPLRQHGDRRHALACLQSVTPYFWHRLSRP